MSICASICSVLFSCLFICGRTRTHTHTHAHTHTHSFLSLTHTLSANFKDWFNPAKNLYSSSKPLTVGALMKRLCTRPSALLCVGFPVRRSPFSRTQTVSLALGKQCRFVSVSANFYDAHSTKNSSELPSGGVNDGHSSDRTPNGLPKPLPSTVLIRNLPPDWGRTEVAAFVMDCLGADGAPMDLPESFMKDLPPAPEADPLHESLSVTSFGTVSAATNDEGISVDSAQWFPVRRVKMFYSAKKGATLRKALVVFNPYPNLTGVVGAIRPDHSKADQSGTHHPLVRKMLRVNPEDVAPGINDSNRRFMGRQKLVHGSGLVEIIHYEDKSKAKDKYPDDRTKWTDSDRVLWEANNHHAALETLDIDRFLMSQDLLYDFSRMKQSRYVRQDSISRDIKKTIHVNSFRPSPSTLRNIESGTYDVDEADSSAIEEIGRGSPRNLRIPIPYVDNLRK